VITGEQRASERPVAGLSPWTILRANARRAVPAVVVCLAILIAVDAGVFRSGLFESQLRVSSPDFPDAKLALAARTADARVLYVGDSTVLTGVVPNQISEICGCGPGFNGAFAASTPWLTRAMTEQLLQYEHPSLVVIGVAPWDVDDAGHFVDSELAHELFPPDALARAGIAVDPATWIDAAVARLSAVYGDRLLIKEFLTSLMPGARYDESQRGYYAVPGSATSAAQLSAEVTRMKAVHPGEPRPDAPGAAVITSLVHELRGRGIDVAFLMPPVHPATYAQNGAFIEQGDAAVRALAAAEHVQVIDCRSSVTIDDFRDLLHLRPSGATAHSRCVGEALRARTTG